LRSVIARFLSARSLAMARRASIALCLACSVTAAAATAQTPPDLAASMYEPETVVSIELTLPAASIEALEAEPEEYQPGTFSLAATDGTPVGVGEASTPIDVGIRLKGQGSFKALTGKAAFKIKFNELVKGQKFLGLKKLTLNNMVQDSSMVHEALAYEAFRAAGVAAPRTGYAYVHVNGEDYGLYLNVETLDDVGLARWFGATAHLYEGSHGSDVTPGGAGAFEIDEGDEEDRTDLEALIAAANEETGDWSDGMAGVADLSQMVRMWAGERYVGQWDGYSGIEGVSWPNNFYLHSDPAGEFEMLPWGTDSAWSNRLPFEGDAGLLFDRCLADTSCNAAYETALSEVSAAIATLDLDSRAVAIAELLRPWQEMDPRQEHTVAETAEAVEATRAFIAARPAELAAWLAEPEGEPEPVAGPEPSSSQLFAPSPSVAAGTMRAGRSTVAGGFLTTRLSLPGPGRISKRATIGVGGAVMACASRLEVKGAGATALRCQLSADARRRLRARWLRLEVEIRFSPQAASPESITRTVVARRTSPG
jgi:CotH kinase protein